MGEVQRVNDRLSDIGIGLPRQAAEPGFHGIDALADGRKAPAIDHPLDRADLLVRLMRVLVGYSDGRRDVAEGNEIVAKLGESCVGIERLVAGVRVEQCRLFVEHDLLEDRGKRLPLGKPLPPVTRQRCVCLSAIERNEPGCPAVGNAKPVQFVEQARKGYMRKPKHGQRTQMASPDCRRQSTGQRLVAQETIEIGRYLGNADRMALGRDAAMKIGERLLIVEGPDFGQDRREQIDCTIGFLDESLKMIAIAFLVAVKSLLVVNLAVMDAALRRTFDRLVATNVERTPERSFSDLLRSSRAVAATTGCTFGSASVPR